MLHVALTVAALIFEGTECRERHWRGTTAWAAPNSWKGNRPPCPGDKVNLPSSLEIPLEIRGETPVSMIVLPRHGVVALAPRATLSVLRPNFKGFDRNCKPGEATYVRSRVESWLGDSWEGNTLATPHMERFPCAGDRADFPTQYDFAVVMPDIPVTVGAVSLRTTTTWQTLSETEWRQLTMRQVANSLFLWRSDKGAPPGLNVEITGNLCDDCPCGHDYLSPVLCPRLACPPTPCVQPLRPHGHCCKICGGIIHFIGDTNLTDLNIIVKDYVDWIGFHVAFHISPIENKNYQITMIEEGPYTTDLSTYMDGLANFVQSARPYSSIHYLYFSSGTPTVPPSIGRTAIHFFGYFFLVAVTFLVIYVYHYDQLPDIPTWNQIRSVAASKYVYDQSLFARFRYSSERSDIEIGRESITDENETNAFSNPMFNDDPQVSGEAAIKETQLELGEEVTTFVESDLSTDTE